MATIATKCHYEILQVERNVDEAGLKKAYRKLALKWHPDKNPERVDECTRIFAVIQKAYDVLGDPQERAWYDKHREAIIRGGFGDDYEDDFINIMAYFNSSAFTAFDDSDEGFYSVYSDVFSKIAEEDKRFKEPGDSDYDIPGFGSCKSDYDEVVGPFYNYWQSYFTSRSFVWVEEYNTRDAANGREAKLMERENKKKRDAARKEWNEEVRQLVMFVKKRDKRVQARKKVMEAKAAETARLNAERIESQRMERAKKVHEYAKKGQKVMQDLEADFQQLERDMAAEFGDSLSEESDDDSDSVESELSSSIGGDVDELYCVACNKAFRSQKAFQNHANSKKHKENVMVLTQELEDEESRMREDEEVDGSAKSGDEGSIGEEADEQDVEEEEEQKQKLSKKQKKKRRQQKRMMSAMEDDNEDSTTESPAPVNPEDLSDDLSQKLRLESQDLPHAENGENNDEHNDVTKPNEDNSRVVDSTDGNTEQPDDTEKGGTGEAGTKENIGKPKTKNKKNKGNQPPAQPSAASSQDVLHCNVCRHEFPTRNKLFNHIKSTGHALQGRGGPPVDPQTGGKKGKRKGKKSRANGLE